MFRVFLSSLTVIIIFISVIVILTSLGQEPLTGINDFTKMKKIEREEKKNNKNYMSFVHQSYNEDVSLDRLHIMCGYQCDKAVNKNDTREVI